MTDKERRSYFRVEDDIILDYAVVSQDELDRARARREDTSTAGERLNAFLMQTQAELELGLGKLRASSPAAANCMTLLNRKLNAIAALLPLSAEGQDGLLEQPMTRCNLSASGIAFETGEMLDAGSIVKLRLIIPPSYELAVVFGEVIRCDPVADEAGRYMLAIDFRWMTDEVKEILISNSLRKEAALLRARRKRDDADPSKDA
ncbi:MAG: PilZ domain-containing protein [Pseudomonadota bacterium]